MSTIDDLLQYKPLNEWQQEVYRQGRSCEMCGTTANITAPITDNDKMLRISCPACGHITYEFPQERGQVIIADFKKPH